MSDTVGNRLKKLRKFLRKNQEEMAADLGISNKTISGIERGHSDLSKMIRNLLERTYNVNLEWLETGIGEMFTAPSAVKERSSGWQPPDQHGTAREDMLMESLLLTMNRLVDQQAETNRNLGRILENLGEKIDSLESAIKKLGPENPPPFHNAPAAREK